MERKHRGRISRNMQMTKKYMDISQNKITVATMLMVLIGTKIIFTILFAFTHNSNFYYDDSNTFRISLQNPSEIRKILAYEQNLPLYYSILHFLFNLLGNSYLYGQLLNLLFWLISCYLFYLISRKYIEKKTWNYLSLLLFVGSTSIGMYAYHLRMYSIIICLSLYTFLISLKFMENRKFWHLVIIDIMLSILSLLHMTTLLFSILVITSLTTFSLIKKIKSMALYTLLCIILVTQFVLVTSQVLTKHNPISIYFNHGIEYISRGKVYFFSVPSIFLFSKNALEYDLFVYGIFILLSYKYLRVVLRKYKTDHKLLILTIYPITFLLLVHTAYKYLQVRHFLYFVPFLYLTIAYSIYTDRGKYNRVAFSILLLFFLAANISDIVEWGIYLHSQKTLCQEIRNIKQGAIITDYFNYNAIDYCSSDNADVSIYVLHKNKIESIKDYSEIDILTKQAQNTGHASFSVSHGLYTDYINKDTKNRLISEGNIKEDTAYVIFAQFPRKVFLKEEVELLEGFELIDKKDPAILVFSRKT